METKTMYLALDLKEDHVLIEKYKDYHAAGNAWPEVTQFIKDSGIIDMEIYLTGNRLFMVMTVDKTYDPLRNDLNAINNSKVQEWEQLMDTFQQRLPWAEEGQKWIPMECIFKLRS